MCECVVGKIVSSNESGGDFFSGQARRVTTPRKSRLHCVIAEKPSANDACVAYCLRPEQSTLMANILVIDDDSGVRGVLKLILQRAGHQVYDAGFGQEGLELLLKQTVDLVLVDVEMPGLTGFEVCRSIKSNPLFSSIAVVIMTGRPSDEGRERAFAEGALTLLTKPFDRRTLLEGVPAWIEQAGGEQK